MDQELVRTGLPQVLLRVRIQVTPKPLGFRSMKQFLLLRLRVD